MSTDQFFSCIALSDISDHLPIFGVINAFYKEVTDKRYSRDYQQFDKKEAYLRELMQTDWNTKLNNLTNNINQTTNDVIKTTEEISNKHAPIKKVSCRKLKQFTKPWITYGILKSIKTKQKMYHTHFFSNDCIKVKQYKKYSNKLNKIKLISKRNYYNTHFTKCENNLKATWELIGTSIQRKSKSKISRST